MSSWLGEEPDRETLERLYKEASGTSNTSFDSVLAVIEGKVGYRPLSLDQTIEGEDSDSTVRGDLIADER